MTIDSKPEVLEATRTSQLASPASDTWYKDGVIYQTHVRTFCDSDGDGIGDFPGLTRKLGYLQDLGVNILWLLPFYPSPLRDDGYDIADYMSIHPSYGTLDDFKTFLSEAHRGGLRVVTELVINHTSDQHPWFQRARHAPPGSPWREFYVWSDTPEKYGDARIIFKDFETSNWSWDPVAKAYYWHRFFTHQPDLNFNNPAVHQALIEAFDFWLSLGVDGFRLDAIPYLYEREGTTCENLPETHQYLRELRAHLNAKFPGRMLLAEANQWPEDSRPYFGDGDECHMAFNFPVMPRMYMALAQEDRFPIIDIMAQTPAIPESCQWALFLRNHDELTLETVTDEDRDYMLRTYAQDRQARINLGIRRRLAPLLGNQRARIQLMNGLLMSLPGTPVIYYGDEIGMGDNIYLGDRNGVRTPMQWSADRNAGFSHANPQRLYLPVVIDPPYHYELVNVESQQSSQHSLLWWMKRLIALRKRYCAFGRGTMEFLHPENRKILAFIRRYRDEIILVVANLSRLVQCFELDLSELRGMVPVELSGGTKFPEIADRPYVLNLGPFAFYWFALERKSSEVTAVAEIPVIDATTWTDILADRNRHSLTSSILRYIRAQRWFGGRDRTVSSIGIRDAAALPDGKAYLTLIDIEYTDGDPDLYSMPLGLMQARRAEEAEGDRTSSVIARLGEGFLLFEPVADASFAGVLLEVIRRHRKLAGQHGNVAGIPTSAFDLLRGEGPLDMQVIRSGRSGTAIVYGQRLLMKLFRRLEKGESPELEVTRFLAQQTTFRNAPAVAGAVEYGISENDPEPTTLAVLQSFAANAGDAWKYALDSISRYFEAVLSNEGSRKSLVEAMPTESLYELARRDTPALSHELIGPFLDQVALLGVRTAQLHLALSSRDDIQAFAPEPFTPYYQRSIYQQIRSQAMRTLILLHRAKALPDDARPSADAVLAREADIQKRIRTVLDRRITGSRIRTHGDYHLGQVLHTGNDFVIIDFEGEPMRPLSERRIKRSALSDVAGMLRSLHHAPYAVVFGHAESPVLRAEDAPLLEAAARFWHCTTRAVFLRAYLSESAKGNHLPQSEEELQVLLDVYLLDRALCEITYELNHRPDWVRIPLRGVLDLLG